MLLFSKRRSFTTVMVILLGVAVGSLTFTGKAFVRILVFGFQKESKAIEVL